MDRIKMYIVFICVLCACTAITVIKWQYDTITELKSENTALKSVIEQQRKQLTENNKKLQEYDKKVKALRQDARRGQNELQKTITETNDNCIHTVVNSDILQRLR